jgi:integral membrane sensor domain MASE1
VIPGYPLSLLAKAALGFFLAGMAAGVVTGRRGWLAGLLGFALVLTLALATLVVTLDVTGLGPAFLINGATANGDTAAVGKVQGDLLRDLLRFAVGAAFLSLLGGAAGSALRYWSHSGRLRGV